MCWLVSVAVPRDVQVINDKNKTDWLRNKDPTCNSQFIPLSCQQRSWNTIKTNLMSRGKYMYPLVVLKCYCFLPPFIHCPCIVFTTIKTLEMGRLLGIFWKADVLWEGQESPQWHVSTTNARYTFWPSWVPVLGGDTCCSLLLYWLLNNANRFQTFKKNHLCKCFIEEENAFNPFVRPQGHMHNASWWVTPNKNFVCLKGKLHRVPWRGCNIALL